MTSLFYFTLLLIASVERSGLSIADSSGQVGLFLIATCTNVVHLMAGVRLSPSDFYPGCVGGCAVYHLCTSAYERVGG